MPPGAARLPREEGFTIIENLVSMVLFALMAVIAVGLIVEITSVSRTDTRRVTADNLANQAIEAARSQRALDIPAGGTTSQVLVDGTAYNVAQTANFVSSGDQTSICNTSSGSRIAYKLVTVSVTWPNMGNVKPVRADTLRSLGIGTDGLNVGQGVAAVGVQDNTGAPVNGIAVTLAPTSVQVMTGADGCAVFAGLDPAVTYTASVNQPGYVGTDGTQSVTTRPIGIAGGSVSRVPLSYAQPGTLMVPYVAPAQTAVPSALAFSLNSSKFQTPTRVFPYCAGGASGCLTAGPGSVTAASLFPNLYTAWAGTCGDAKPSSPPGATVAAAGTATASPAVSLAGLTVTVSASGGQPGTIQSITAVHAADATCASGERYVLNNPANGTGIALPAGTWTATINYTYGTNAPATTSFTGSLVAGSATPVTVTG